LWDYFFIVHFVFLFGITVALPQSPPALALRVGLGGDWRQCVVIRFYLFVL